MPEPANRPRIRSRAWALAIFTSLALTGVVPSPVLAAPAESGNAEAETIFRRGQAKYETADYAGAIELWTEAYGLVDSTPQNAGIKALLIYNLAQAHVKAYELDEDAIHLKQAQQLLQSFKANLSLLYEDEAQLAEEQAKVDERLVEVDAMIAELDKPEPKEPEPDEPEPPAPVVEPPDTGEPTDTGAGNKSGKPLIAAGGAVLGLGAAFGVVGIVGAVMGASANDITDLGLHDYEEREARFASGRTGNSLLIVGSIGAGVLIPTGIALIVVGIKRNKAVKPGASALREHGPRLGASFGGGWGHGGGLSLSGKF